jgi:DNA gyrase subunit A
VAVLDTELSAEAKQRYLTYALSVVSSRALPDVRDGLKPVQRRILYAMDRQLHLTPDKAHRKSAAVVGEVLARFHPHGDAACYEAMVRMAQDFSLRYPLVDGQGNFGSLDGDAAAAYRYTEARLTPIALELLSELGQDTVSERDNFDQTTKEPVVLPARFPNLLVNGASGIAVGMATSIPPHNLRDVIKALLLIIEDESVSDAKVTSAVKAPDFPTGCLILNTTAELKEIYTTGRGAIRMRGEHTVETDKRGKKMLVVTSIPYAIDKSVLVEKIAELITSRKLPQLVDIRDESTDSVRVVMDLADGADAEKAVNYLFRNTTLQSNFNVNLTALVPTTNPFTARPELLSLRQILNYFLDFRLEVTTSRLTHERDQLKARIHLLEGLLIALDVLDEVLKIVRKSEGRSDAAAKLQQRFKLSELQSFFIVDLRIYQLSKTDIAEVTGELTLRAKRVEEIEKLLKSKKALLRYVASELEAVAEQHGDARRSKLVTEFEEPEVNQEEYIVEEETTVVVSRDGWVKRMKSGGDVSNTRLREGDEIKFTDRVSTTDYLLIYSTFGTLFALRVADLPATTGYGEPIQKLLRFQDGEGVATVMLQTRAELQAPDFKRELLLFTKRGTGFRVELGPDLPTKKSGRKMMRVGDNDALVSVTEVNKKYFVTVSSGGYVTCFDKEDVPLRGGVSQGVTLVRLNDGESLVAVESAAKGDKFSAVLENGKTADFDFSDCDIGSRAKRGLKLIKKGLPVVAAARKIAGKTVH